MKYGRAGFKSLLPEKLQLNTSPSLGICLIFQLLDAGKGTPTHPCWCGRGARIPWTKEKPKEEM